MEDLSLLSGGGEVATVERVGSAGLVWRGGCSEKVANLEEAYDEQGANVKQKLFLILKKVEQ